LAPASLKILTHPNPLFEKEREFLLFFKEEVRRS